MKIKLVLIILSFSFLFSCSSWDNLESYREVGFTSTTITNVNDRNVTFANGLQVETNRIIIAVNSTPVLLVVENYTGSGYFFLRNSKVRFSIAKSESQQDVDIDLLGLRRGEVNYIQELDNTNKTITLADNSKWTLPNPQQWEQASKWLTTPEIIIPYNKPPKGVFFINTTTSESVLAVRVENPTTNTDK